MAKATLNKRTAARKKAAGTEKAPAKDASVICFNKDCKLRKKKSCKGFEGCPGFLGR